MNVVFELNLVQYFESIGIFSILVIVNIITTHVVIELRYYDNQIYKISYIKVFEKNTALFIF